MAKLSKITVLFALVFTGIHTYPQEATTNLTVLCDSLYIYDAPAPDATITKVLYFENIVSVFETTTDNTGTEWWNVNRIAHDPNLNYTGWVSTAEVADCPEPAQLYQMMVKDTREMLQPGDLVLSYFGESGVGCAIDYRCLGMHTMYAGSWHHSGIIAEQDGELVIVEARPGDGVVVNPLEETSHYDAERSIVLRVNAPESVRAAAAEYALAQVGKRFSDNYLATDDSAFYCSKLLWAAYEHTAHIDLDADYRVWDSLKNYLAVGGANLMLTGAAVLNPLVTPDDIFWSAYTHPVIDFSSTANTH